MNAVPARQRAVLVVDDEVEMAEEIADGLRAEGYEAEMVHGGEDALALVAADPHRFAVVVTDIRMPGMDGLTLARRLRQEAGASPVPQIVFITGHAVPSEIAPALAPMPVEVARKPFRWDELVTLIDRALERAEGQAA